MIMQFLQITNKLLINFAYLKIHLSEVENIFEGSLVRSLVCRPAFCPSRLISSCFRRSTTTPRETAKRHWEERENKDCRKAPCVVAFSTEEYGGCATLGGSRKAWAKNGVETKMNTPTVRVKERERHVVTLK